MKVVVKWGKQVFDVEVDVAQPPLVFKSQLFALTAVPPERQKVMAKGGRMLRDDADDLSALSLKEGQKIIMMGTPDAADANGGGEGGGIIKPPTKEIKFVEDLPEDEQVGELKTREKKKERGLYVCSHSCTVLANCFLGSGGGNGDKRSSISTRAPLFRC